jgi:hypothetical protein
MSTTSVIESVQSNQYPKSPDPHSGTVLIAGNDNGLYERHLLFDNVIDRTAADSRESLRSLCAVGKGYSFPTLGIDREHI